MSRRKTSGDGAFAREDFAMNANIGTIDRALRIAIGLALIAGALSGMIGARGWIGAVPLATGLFRFCPAYRLLGLGTCSRNASL
jgi:hypothetical protein